VYVCIVYVLLLCIIVSYLEEKQAPFVTTSFIYHNTNIVKKRKKEKHKPCLDDSGSKTT